MVRTTMGDDFVAFSEAVVAGWTPSTEICTRFVQSKAVKKHPQMEARGLQHSPFTRFSPTAAPAKSTTCTIMVILITAHPPLPKLEHHRPPPRHLLQRRESHQMGTERAVQRRQPGCASRAIPGAGHTSVAATPCPSVDGYAPKSPATIHFPDFFLYL